MEGERGTEGERSKKGRKGRGRESKRWREGDRGRVGERETEPKREHDLSNITRALTPTAHCAHHHNRNLEISMMDLNDEL